MKTFGLLVIFPHSTPAVMSGQQKGRRKEMKNFPFFFSMPKIKMSEKCVFSSCGNAF
jgi:hypothetical protein